MAKPKKRKQKRIDVVIDGKTVKKAINYYTLEEYEEKKKKVLEEANRANNTTFKKIAEDCFRVFRVFRCEKKLKLRRH